MFQNLDVFRLAHDMSRHAGTRQTLVARNMANADTPGYQPQDLTPFRDLVRGADPFRGQLATRGKHLNGKTELAGARSMAPATITNDPNGNAVSLEQEMLRAVSVKRQHDRALAIYKSSLNILRASIGR